VGLLYNLGVRRVHFVIIFWVLVCFEIAFGVILFFNYSRYNNQMLLVYLGVDIPFILLMILFGYFAYIAKSKLVEGRRQ